MNPSSTSPPLLANQCIEPQVLAHLGDLGFDVVPLVEITGTGDLDDDVVLRIAAYANRALLTYDKSAEDFEALDNPDSPGLIIVRNRIGSFESIAQRVATAFDSIDASDLPGSIVVIEPGRMRLRHSDGQTTTFGLTQ